MKKLRMGSDDPDLMDAQDCRPVREDSPVLREDLPDHLAPARGRGGLAWRYIENEGALFKGYARGMPEQVYSFRQRKWLPYEGSVPRPVDWGEFITEEEAEAWIARESRD
jgi:hypothetical protein